MPCGTMTGNMFIIGPIPSRTHHPAPDPIASVRPVSRTPPPPLFAARRTKKIVSLPSSARLFSHFTTLDPHR